MRAPHTLPSLLLFCLSFACNKGSESWRSPLGAGSSSDGFDCHATAVAGEAADADCDSVLAGDDCDAWLSA
jgi:hypothetical protein